MLLCASLLLLGIAFGFGIVAVRAFSLAEARCHLPGEAPEWLRTGRAAASRAQRRRHQRAARAVPAVLHACAPQPRMCRACVPWLWGAMGQWCAPRGGGASGGGDAEDEEAGLGWLDGDDEGEPVGAHPRRRLAACRCVCCEPQLAEFARQATTRAIRVRRARLVGAGRGGPSLAEAAGVLIADAGTGRGELDDEKHRQRAMYAAQVPGLWEEVQHQRPGVGVRRVAPAVGVAVEL